MKKRHFFTLFVVGIIIGFFPTLLLYPSCFFGVFNRIDTQRFHFIGAGQMLYEQKKGVAALLAESKPIQSVYTPNVLDSIDLYRSANGSLIVAGELGQIVWMTPERVNQNIRWHCLEAPSRVYNCP